MNYDQVVGQAPGTTPELFKAAILAALKDIDTRLSNLEQTLAPEEAPSDT